MRASHEADKAELVAARRKLWAAQEAERLERDSSEDDAEEEEEAAALRADVARLTGALQQAEAEADAAEADAAEADDSSADPSPVPSSGSAHSGTAPANALGVAQRTLSFGRAFGRKARPDAVRQQQLQTNASAPPAPPAPDSGAAPARTQSFGRRGARAALGAASLLSRSVSRKAPNNATSETAT